MIIHSMIYTIVPGNAALKILITTYAIRTIVTFQPSHLAIPPQTPPKILFLDLNSDILSILFSFFKLIFISFNHKTLIRITIYSLVCIEFQEENSEQQDCENQKLQNCYKQIIPNYFIHRINGLIDGDQEKLFYKVETLKRVLMFA